MNPNFFATTEIIRTGNYPELAKADVEQINVWLKIKFGADFQCKNANEASRLIKSITVWVRGYAKEIQAYIESGVWQDQPMDFKDFQTHILAKEFGRSPHKRKPQTLNKLLEDMLILFRAKKKTTTESVFEQNKIRNFIASSKLEGIYLEDV